MANWVFVVPGISLAICEKNADLTGLLSVRSSGSVATSTSAGLAGGHVFAIHAEADGNKWSELPEPPSLN